MDNRRKWAIVLTLILSFFFGQDIAVAITQPLVDAVGSVLPAR